MTTIMITRERKDLLAKKQRIIKKKRTKNTPPFPLQSLKGSHPIRKLSKSLIVLFLTSKREKKKFPKRCPLRQAILLSAKFPMGQKLLFIFFFKKKKERKRLPVEIRLFFRNGGRGRNQSG